MTQSTFTFRVDSELKEAFAQIAQEQDRTAAQLLRDFMRQSIRETYGLASQENWNIWLSAKVDAGRADIKEGRFISQEQAEQNANDRRERLMGKAKS